MYLSHVVRLVLSVWLSGEEPDQPLMMMTRTGVGCLAPRLHILTQTFSKFEIFIFNGKLTNVLCKLSTQLPMILQLALEKKQTTISLFE